MSLRVAWRRSSVVAIALAATVVGTAVDASAAHSWGGYHWARATNPVTVQLGDDVDATWQSYFDNASKDWSASAVLEAPVAVGAASPKTCRPTAGRVEVCNAKYGRNGWLGLAQIWLSGDHITQGTAKMNDTYFALPEYNNANERRHVMCQEVGHTFGLGHTSEDGSSQDTCMDYSQSSTSTQPNRHDFDVLGDIYAHLDSTTTASPGPSSSPAASGLDDPREWGRLVERSSDGSHRVYVRNLADGQRLVTFVTGVQ